MEENLIEAQYDVTKKSRLVVFYRSYKKLIISLAVFLFILLISIISYSSIKDKKKIQLSENYLKAKTYIELGNVNKGKNILKEIIYSNDKTKVSKLFDLYKSYPQIKSNIKINKTISLKLANDIKKIEVDYIAKYKNFRILIRKSGTEPLYRVLVEGNSVKNCLIISSKITNRIKKSIDAG